MGSWLNIGTAARRAGQRSSRGVVDVSLHGPLNMLTVAAQEQKIFAAVTDSDDDVLLDLSDITRLTAVGVQMVLYVRSVLAGAGRTLIVVGGHPELERRIRESGSDQTIAVHRTRELALRYR